MSTFIPVPIPFAELPLYARIAIEMADCDPANRFSYRIPVLCRLYARTMALESNTTIENAAIEICKRRFAYSFDQIS
jgi:hypothetical protein